MKKFNYIFFTLILSVIIMTGCSDDKEDSTIILPNPGEKTQTAFADEETTGGFTFSAQSSWTATILEKTVKSNSIYEYQGIATKANRRKPFALKQNIPGSAITKSLTTPSTKSTEVSWIKLLLDGKETYSGNAGTFTIIIELEPNYTGNSRVAEITIACGNDKITITVSQDGKTEEGKEPENPQPPVTGDKLISKITSNGKYIEDGKEVGYWDNKTYFTYDAENRLTTVKTDEIENYMGVHEENVLEISFIYQSNTITYKSAKNEPGKEYTKTAIMTLDNGRIISGDAYNSEVYSSHSLQSESVFSTSYSNGYLQTLIEKNKSKWTSGETQTTSSGTYTNSISWTDGNLTAISCKCDYVDEGKNKTEGPYKSVTTYGNDINKTNLDLNWLAYRGEWLAVMDEYGFPVLGYYGKRSKNLVIGETADAGTYSAGPNPTPAAPYVFNYSWTFDKDGYPVSVTTKCLPRVINTNGDIDEGYTEVYNIEYDTKQ